LKAIEEWEGRLFNSIANARRWADTARADPRWFPIAEKLLEEVLWYGCRDWCRGEKLWNAPDDLEGLRFWCDLQREILWHAEDPRVSERCVRWESRPPDGPGGCLHAETDPKTEIDLREAAAPVLCFLDEREPEDWPRAQGEVCRLSPRECGGVALLSADDLNLMVRKAWGAMRRIKGHVPPMQTDNDTIPKVHRALDIVMEWLDRRTAPTQAVAVVPACPQPEAPVPRYVDLRQAAALVHKKKRALEHLKEPGKDPLPPADVDARRGSADLWLWTTIAPWLERTFHIPLTQLFPNGPPDPHR
jgi:hypothetical protein